MTRHELREMIFKTIFQIPFYEDDVPELPEAADGSEIKEKDAAYISEKVSAIKANLGEIDKIIEEHSNSWKIKRIGKTELAILRLAVYEVKFDEEIPEKVAVNEAIELAKVYGDDKAPGFINGVLSGLLS